MCIDACGGSSGRGKRRDATLVNEREPTCRAPRRAVSSYAGTMCATPCSDDMGCPSGLACHELTGANGAVGAFCIEPMPTLCQPCDTHVDCNPDTPETNNQCINQGAVGSFCGGHCEPANSECPLGFSCRTFETETPPVTVSQCMPDDALCSCSPLAISVGATTSCQLEGEAGACSGTRTCTADGLSECTAQEQAEEVCNGRDDDCDGLTDEGVQSPCGGCNTDCSFDIDVTVDQGIGTSSTPQRFDITTEQVFEGNPHIWIANSAENTVSRLNTKTGCEEARYAVCKDPSRTAVGVDGAGVVGCRGDGFVYKISVDSAVCVDSNNNGVIDTSADANGDCVIQPDEMVPNDECIVWKTQPITAGSPCARAAGIDAEGHIWVGMWNAKQLFQLHRDTGAVLTNHSINMSPYGLAIDREGIIWVASRDPNGVLLKVHPDTGVINSWTNPAGENYGLAVDPFNGVWVATGWATSGLARFDMITETWQTYTNGGEATRGVAVRLNTNEAGLVTGATVYASQYAGECTTNQYVTAIDAETGTLLPVVDIGSGMGPVGVAIDSDGYLWTVNQCANSASKIDAVTGELIGTYPVGNGPYTYSDMTGYALKTITTVSRRTSKRLTGWETGSTYWKSLTFDAEFPNDKTSLTVTFRTGESADVMESQEWSETYGPFTSAGTFPVPIERSGYILDVQFTLASQSTSVFPTLNGFTVEASQAP